jgi:uncharacterized hydrophobic protein (TIGR00271 family)
MKKIIWAINDFISERFNLHEDKANEQVIIEAIEKDTNFKGTNLWTLIFAIFIASIGLNVNSTAVIIGAMLISPLMGPIMGVGLGIGINDFDLIKRGIKNLVIAAIFSMATSFLYFTLTPLEDASSEILARTTPSIWDVFIAFFGGLAGIVAGTRKEKSNVIPGVAIATALMPPLCTAGYGLASGQWFYFFGALYLFFINSVFICIATFLIIKHLKFKKKQFATEETQKRVSRYILFIVIITIIPSIYMAYRIVQRSIFEGNARKFVQNEFHFDKTQVLSSKFTYRNNDEKNIELFLVGKSLSEATIDSLKNRIADYKLEQTDLVIHQGVDAAQKVDLSAIKASVLDEVFAANLTKSADVDSLQTEGTFPDLQKELRILYPDLTVYSLDKTVFNYSGTERKDTVTLFVASFRRPVTSKEKKKLQYWLKERIQADNLRFIIQ